VACLALAPGTRIVGIEAVVQASTIRATSAPKSA
jgi:hypothetical protein